MGREIVICLSDAIKGAIRLSFEPEPHHNHTHHASPRFAQQTSYYPQSPPIHGIGFAQQTFYHPQSPPLCCPSPRYFHNALSKMNAFTGILYPVEFIVIFFVFVSHCLRLLSVSIYEASVKYCPLRHPLRRCSPLDPMANPHSSGPSVTFPVKSLLISYTIRLSTDRLY